jgi:hypothetical protein
MFPQSQTDQKRPAPAGSGRAIRQIALLVTFHNYKIVAFDDISSALRYSKDEEAAMVDADQLE